MDPRRLGRLLLPCARTSRFARCARDGRRSYGRSAHRAAGRASTMIGSESCRSSVSEHFPLSATAVCTHFPWTTHACPSTQMPGSAMGTPIALTAGSQATITHTHTHTPDGGLTPDPKVRVEPSEFGSKMRLDNFYGQSSSKIQSEIPALLRLLSVEHLST